VVLESPFVNFDQIIFEGVFALHPDIRISLDLWIAVVRMILHLWRPFSVSFIYFFCYCGAKKASYFDFLIWNRLEVFIHIWFHEFKGIRVELDALCLKMRSWWQCFPCSSSLLNPILFMHMLVDSMLSPLYFKTALELMVKPLTIPCKLTSFYILKPWWF